MKDAERIPKKLEELQKSGELKGLTKHQQKEKAALALLLDDDSKEQKERREEVVEALSKIKENLEVAANHLIVAFSDLKDTAQNNPMILEEPHIQDILRQAMESIRSVQTLQEITKMAVATYE